MIGEMKSPAEGMQARVGLLFQKLPDAKENRKKAPAVKKIRFPEEVLSRSVIERQENGNPVPGAAAGLKGIHSTRV